MVLGGVRFPAPFLTDRSTGHNAGGLRNTVMDNYITNMEFASTVVSVSKVCGVADTDVVNISVGSHDIQIHLKNTDASTAFQAKCVDMFKMRFIGSTAHCTDNKMFVTNSWRACPDTGPVVVEFTLSGRA